MGGSLSPIFLIYQSITMKSIIHILTVAAIASLSIACSSTTKEKVYDQDNSCFECYASDTIDISVVDAPTVLSEIRLDNFDLDYFKQTALANNSRNFVISPVGTSFTIAMMANICDTPLQRQIVKALNYENLEQLNRSAAKRLKHLTKRVSGHQIYVGNSLWINSNSPVLLSAEQKDSLRVYLDASVEDIDFTSCNAHKTIQDWGQKASAGHLTPSFSSIGSDCGFIFMNLLYYSGMWNESFNINATRSRPFHGYEGDTIVNMMSLYLYTSYHSNSNFRAVSLKLKNGCTMHFLQPRKDLTTDSLIMSLNSSDIDRIKRQSKINEIQLFLPKFQIKCDHSAVETLKLLGFSLSPAQFQKIGLIHRDGIEIDQTSKISVDEDGVEASSDTHMVTCILCSPEEPKTITFDRPFVFLLQDNQTGAIISAGQYVGPE